MGFLGSAIPNGTETLLIIPKTVDSELAKLYLDEDITIKTDDELDAFVSWLITKAFYDNTPYAQLFGDKTKGAFLLYNAKEINCEL